MSGLNEELAREKDRCLLPLLQSEAKFRPDDKKSAMVFASYNESPLLAVVGEKIRTVLEEKGYWIRFVPIKYLFVSKELSTPELRDQVRALESLAAGTPCDLVLVDIGHPANDDFQDVVGKLKRAVPSRPIISMTAFLAGGLYNQQIARLSKDADRFITLEQDGSFTALKEAVDYIKSRRAA